jgi:hypothetical protein
MIQSQLGDYMSSTCPHCRNLVRSRLEFRSVELARTRLVVRDVKVHVCPDCGHMISFAQESVPQLREAGCPK